jgi:UDP-GlcNAc:undecaprenyl-phosphate GlcNAc-1-phosphate transferase
METEKMPALLFLTSLLTTIIFIVVLYPCAQKIGFLDKPNYRKHHQKPVPLIGGAAIYLAILFTLLVTDIQIFQQTGFIAAATILVLVGLLDDYREVAVKYRILAQIIATLIMTEISEIKIMDLGDLFGTGHIKLEAFSTAFTVFAVVGGINAFNMIDGIDGLSGSLALVSVITIAILSWSLENWLIYYYCLILAATIIAFLLFNLRIFGRKSAAIFLGDTGSTLLGFSVCWLAIYASQGENAIITPTTVLWLIAIPLLDSVSVMCRRMSKGRSPFYPDREHLHHLLALAGYKVNQKLIIIVVFAVFFSGASIMAPVLLSVSEQMSFISFLCLFAVYYWCTNKVCQMQKSSKTQTPCAESETEQIEKLEHIRLSFLDLKSAKSLSREP